MREEREEPLPSTYGLSKRIRAKGLLAMQEYSRKAEQDEFSSARVQLEAAVERLRSEAVGGLEHGELEELIVEEGREIQRRLMQGHLDLRAANEAVQKSVQGTDEVERSHRRRGVRPLATVVGLVTVLRTAYGARGSSSLCPMDQALNLPVELYSHGLRKLAAVEAARGSYEATQEAIERGTGSAVPKRQVEQLVERAAQDFDSFYLRPDAEVAEAGAEDLLVMSLDGKGIVMRKGDLREETRKAAAKGQPKLARRVSRGEKRNRKRMATVAAVYDVAPHPRTPEEVLAELRPVRDAGKVRPRARNKRVWASVEKTPEAVTKEVFDEALRRDPRRKRRWVALVDGDRHQIDRVRAAARSAGVEVTLVLDLIHVLEHLWKAAWCFFEEGDKRIERWVTERGLGILQGRSSDVAAGIRRSATLRGLAAADRTGVDECADYLIAKRDLLHYDQYLPQGLPIATGVIEGACRHLIKDRMDITGARWSLQGAEAVLRLRSLRSSGDFHCYWDFHLAHELERNHTSLYAAAA